MTGVSRRRFLVGGTALAGATVFGGMRVADRLGAFDGPGPDRAVPDAGGDIEVEHGELARSGRRYRLARTGAGAGRAAVAIVCLHGRNNDESFAFDRLGIHRFAASAGLDTVIASIDGGAADYWHPRQTGANPLGDVVGELVPLLDERSGGAPRAVMGWSMGGYGALLAAIEHPGVFRRVIATAPAVWERYADSAKGAFDGRDDFARYAVLGRLDRLAGTFVRIDCGVDDPFAPVSRRLLRETPGATGEIGPGGHQHAAWRWLLPVQLQIARFS